MEIGSGIGLAKLVVALRPSNWGTELEATDMVAAMAAMVTIMAPSVLGIEDEEAGGMQRRQRRGARGKALVGEMEAFVMAIMVKMQY
jgi:hypothetical protein